MSGLLLPRSVPRRAFDEAVSHGLLLVSDPTIAELNEVLRRPKFNPYVSEAQRLEFLEALLHQAELVDVVDVVNDCRDPKDNKFLELAISGRANGVVSGDFDLLSMHPFRGVPIVSPLEFLRSIKALP